MTTRSLLTGSLLFALLPAVHAKQWCSNGDIIGTYAMLASGAIIQPEKTPLTGPFARVGIVVADGNGNISANNTASYNGALFRESYSGTYTVNSDCTVTFQLLLPEPIKLPATLVGILSEDFKEIRFLLSAPAGTTIGGVLRRQDIKWCTVADLNGTYQFELSGTFVPPSTQTGGFARLGRLAGLGNGNFVVNSTASYNGAIVNENFTGTYTVTPDCRFEMKYTVKAPPGAPAGTPAAAPPVTLEGTFADKGRTASLIVTDPAGAVITGTLKVQ
ncbi:MAG: hypothetical protein ACRD8O_01035 [Bryobacteraceae bacterium]